MLPKSAPDLPIVAARAAAITLKQKSEEMNEHTFFILPG